MNYYFSTTNTYCLIYLKCSTHDTIVYESHTLTNIFAHKITSVLRLTFYYWLYYPVLTVLYTVTCTTALAHVNRFPTPPEAYLFFWPSGVQYASEHKQKKKPPWLSSEWCCLPIPKRAAAAVDDSVLRKRGLVFVRFALSCWHLALQQLPVEPTPPQQARIFSVDVSVLVTHFSVRSCLPRPRMSYQNVWYARCFIGIGC